MFSDTIKGPLRKLYFVVILLGGKVVEPNMARRLVGRKSSESGGFLRLNYFWEVVPLE
jgi:hypothetical protein